MQTASTSPIVDVPLVEATADNTADYGLMLGAGVHKPGLPIPFYKGSVEEGENIDFRYTGKAVVRTARISPRSAEITWLERHLNMTQLFIGMGDQPFVMVLGKPNHDSGGRLPDLDQVVAFKIPPGHGIMIHRGTWHDFPMAIADPVTVLTINSDEVVTALVNAKGAQDMDTGDVYKINIQNHTGKQLKVPF